MNGWLITLVDGCRFAWTEADGVRSERDALARLEPGALVASVEQEEIVLVVELSEN